MFIVHCTMYNVQCTLYLNIRISYSVCVQDSWNKNREIQFLFKDKFKFRIQECECVHSMC